MSPTQPVDFDLSQTAGSAASLQDRVYAELSEALMAGAFLPGELVSIIELARRFGTSAMPVRDAVRRLRAEGALQIEPQKGVRVRQPERAEVAEIVRLRLRLEPELAAAAATRLSGAGLERLAGIARAMGEESQAGPPSRFLQLNKDLHFVLYEAAGLAVTLQIVRTLWARMGPVIRLYAGHAAFAIAPDTPWRVVEAVRAGDATAARRWTRETIRTPATILLADYASYMTTRPARWREAG
jgi:DNA-binding GntR family transcriptional regulator